MMDNLTNDFVTLPSYYYNDYLTVTDKGYILEYPIPGMTKEDVKIQLDKQDIYISAKKDKKNGSSRIASAYQYVYTLPHDVNIDTINAQVENGILYINVDKLETKKQLKDIVIQ
jgi:HSP20 family protein